MEEAGRRPRHNSKQGMTAKIFWAPFAIICCLIITGEDLRKLTSGFVSKTSFDTRRQQDKGGLRQVYRSGMGKLIKFNVVLHWKTLLSRCAYHERMATKRSTWGVVTKPCLLKPQWQRWRHLRLILYVSESPGDVWLVLGSRFVTDVSQRWKLWQILKHEMQVKLGWWLCTHIWECLSDDTLKSIFLQYHES